MTGSWWVHDDDVVGGGSPTPTLFDHARILRTRYGPGPWPGFGDPLPDARPDDTGLAFVGGGEDALLRRTPDGDGVLRPTGIELDTPLLDGGGSILAAMADSQGGPAPGLADYAHAVPVLHRYADLVRVRPPTLTGCGA
ncbi:hypothetical protein ACIBEA_42245 [Streptomyces sp. NPDC051555]|uniref:hypothetical protein n=1 Tax=Streptomyces sp. NPDC051555 TaxID=3365657 RepID=UPI00378A9A05